MSPSGVNHQTLRSVMRFQKASSRSSRRSRGLPAMIAELIAPGRYRLTRLLRGQRGTEGAIGSPAPAGARVVVLDEALAPLPVAEAGLGLEANWRFGPASKPVADRSYRQLGFTPEGVGLRPFSVCHVVQPWRTARAPGDPAHQVRRAVGPEQADADQKPAVQVRPRHHQQRQHRELPRQHHTGVQATLGPQQQRELDGEEEYGGGGNQRPPPILAATRDGAVAR